LKLITEVYEQTNFIVEEKLGKGKEYYIEGIFLQAECKNRNGRIYPEAVMDREVKRYNEMYVTKNRAYGELGHPDSPAINLDRVSHLITELRKDGTNWIGKAKILDTPMGKIARGLLDGGANLGVSSRALGSLKANPAGVQIVQDDFTLATAADIVADPSGPNCFVQGIMEGAEWLFNASTGSWERATVLREEIKRMTTKNISLKQAQMFESFINGLLANK
jgi:hypothetical protein